MRGKRVEYGKSAGTLLGAQPMVVKGCRGAGGSEGGYVPDSGWG